MSHRVLVIGAGVSGLTTALCLLDACRHASVPIQLELWASEFTPNITSDLAVCLFLEISIYYANIMYKIVLCYICI